MKKQIFKRTLALLLCVALIFSLSSVSFAKNMELSKSSSLSTLRSQFNRAKGPKTNGKVIEYSYFSPLKTKSDTKKYPLIIYLPGQGHGKKSGDELKAYSFALWSSKEFQKRVNAGGAYLMAAKSLGSKGEWNSTSLIAPLKAAIDDFLRKNPNVDKSKIVLMGNSYGANGSHHEPDKNHFKVHCKEHEKRSHLAHRCKGRLVLSL